MDHEAEIQRTLTADQRMRLAAALGLTSEKQIDDGVSAIVGTIVAHNMLLAARKRTPDRTKTKRKLLQIADAARKLKLLLCDTEVSQSIGNEIAHCEITPPHMAKLFHRRPLWGDDEVDIKDMFGMLQQIDLNASAMAESDSVFSYYYLLPSQQMANRDFDAGILWPRLFKYWELAGNKVASTPDGPTFRFLGLIHEIADIDPPKLGSLRSACERWRTDPLRDQSEEIPWLA